MNRAGSSLDPADAELLARAANWSGESAPSGLTVESLAEVTRAQGIEFATAFIFDQLRRAPPNAAFAAQVAAAVEPVAPLADVIGIVPGAFHGQHKHTGADGVRIAEIVRGLAPRVEVIPVRSFGPIEENAAQILAWLEARRGARIVLASLSKGGADLKRALASPRATRAFADVTAWVSFSGIVEGTPLTAWLRARPLRSAALALLLRFQGNRSSVIDELRRAPNAPLSVWPGVPPHLRVVHVNGCPLARHLRHRWAPRGYARLASLGPNDGGGILLGDLPRLPGVVHPLWGVDHYLQPAWDATALLRSIVIAAAGEPYPRHATQSAAAPTAAPATRSSA